MHAATCLSESDVSPWACLFRSSRTGPFTLKPLHDRSDGVAMFWTLISRSAALCMIIEPRPETSRLALSALARIHGLLSTGRERHTAETVHGGMLNMGSAHRLSQTIAFWVRPSWACHNDRSARNVKSQCVKTRMTRACLFGGPVTRSNNHQTGPSRFSWFPRIAVLFSWCPHIAVLFSKCSARVRSCRMLREAFADTDSHVPK